MKVTCESCGSKYTIKDEKVRGKRVKIRCKGCKNPIVVDGTSIDAGGGASAVTSTSAPPAQSAATTASAPPASSSEPVAGQSADVAPEQPAAAAGSAASQGTTPGSELWSVNLSETDSRDMSTDEIVAAWGSVVNEDAYVYKPGFSDWVPILEVPELKALLTTVAAGAPDQFSPPAGASPFSPEGAVAANRPEGRSRDLFGAVATAGSEDDPSIAAPPTALPGLEMGKPTGARNESSVLFSLDALKAGFEPNAPAQPPAAVTSHDDPFGLGASGGLSGLGGGFEHNQALLSAPAPEPKKPKLASLAPTADAATGGLDRGKLLMMAGGVLALLIAVGGVGFALGGKADGDEAERAEASGIEKEGRPNARQGNTASEDTESAQDEESAELAANEPDEEADAKADDGKKEEDSETEATDTSPASASKAGSSPAEASKAATPSKADTKRSTKEQPKEAPKEESAAPGFNKSAAISALSSAAANAASCKIPGGPTGSGKAIVTFAPSGRVTTANVVGGKFGGTSVGGCVASKFRRANIPAFSGSSVTVSKSFAIK